MVTRKGYRKNMTFILKKLMFPYEWVEFRGTYFTVTMVFDYMINSISQLSKVNKSIYTLQHVMLKYNSIFLFTLKEDTFPIFSPEILPHSFLML